MPPLVLVRSQRDTGVARLLEALGVVFEEHPLPQALASAGPALPIRGALILSEDELASAYRVQGHDAERLRQCLAPYRHVLVYPFRGSADGLRALCACTAGRAEVARVDGTDGTYRIRDDFAAAGPFAGLTIGPVKTTSDARLLIQSPYPVEHIVDTREGGLFAKITLPVNQLFVMASTAVFDVALEAVKNLDVRECFSGLVPLLFFLRHCEATFWRSPYSAANVIIDDLTLQPRYGFVDVETLARHVDELACAVSIGFIPWNCHRTSRKAVDLFRSRWPGLSLCVHGCDHIGAEFSTESPAASLPMLALSLDRMRSLQLRTGLRYDRVMVFPQGRFSHSAMEALRQTDFVAAVNTDLLDHRANRGIPAGELLKPAITSYAGFPLFLRRRVHEAIGNFALDLLLGKPCLVVTHHNDFQQGMAPLVTLVGALNALDPGLHWTNLETVTARTYSTRLGADSNMDIRLLSRSTVLDPQHARGDICFSKAESLADKDFEILVGRQFVKGQRHETELVFHGRIAEAEPSEVEVRISPQELVELPIRSLRYRGKVAARRYLSEVRDNYVARSSWATAAMNLMRGATPPSVEAR